MESITPDKQENSDLPDRCSRPPSSFNAYARHILALFSGLLFFQSISSLKIHSTNQGLVETMTAAINQGYLAVPGPKILPLLDTMKSSLAGGLFFTLTVGAFVCLLSLAAACIYLALPRMRRELGIVFFLVLSAALVTINLEDFLVFETAAMVAASATTFFVCCFFFKNHSPALSLKHLAIHGIFPLILAVLLFVLPQNKDSRIFSDFRDTFLMSNPLGMTINDFYYTHTLSPAEVFKSLDQKQIKSCHLVLDGVNEMHRPQIEQALLSRDFLILDSVKNPDLVVRAQDQNLLFYRDGKEISTMRLIDFMASPSDLIKNYSKATDSYAPYRKIVGLSLISGLPLLMYILMHGLFFAGLSLAVKGPKAPLAASVCCFAVGLACFFLLYTSTKEPVEGSNIRTLLSSPSLNQRVSALQFLAEHNLDLTFYPAALKSMESPSVLERYWFARAAHKSRDPLIFSKIIALVDDVHPNVACQAFYTLGMMGNVDSVPVIERKIVEARNWYVQWYAYKALKRLGWTQQRSAAKP